MNVQAALKGQYHAALAMLKQTIEQCPDDLWAGGTYPVACWRVVYHALFFTHMYLHRDVQSFRPWPHHRDHHECLGELPYPPYGRPKIGEPYTKSQLLEYSQLCDGMIDAAVDQSDLDAQECGFPWYQLPKLDHQINNIRHLQHHAALLAGRLRLAAGLDIGWVGFG
jgi:hypothetical protein